jgi:hypothetical protein
MIQWIARFESSKVAACLAFWNDSGSLSGLAAKTWPNKATGAWWVYKWYGGMTGNTVALHPPDRNAEGLNGLAALDAVRHQARVIWGGASGPVTVSIKGLSAAGFSGATLHAAVWRVDPSGTEPSNGPVLEREDDYAAATDRIEVVIPHARGSSAYHLILTAVKEPRGAKVAGHYLAEYADPAPGGGTEFVAAAPKDGYYNVKLRYSLARSGTRSRAVGLNLNGSSLAELQVPETGDANTWADHTIRIFLTGGINRLGFQANEGLRLDYIDVSPASGPIIVYEAESGANDIRGTATVIEDGAAWGDKLVASIGDGADNYLQFNGVMAPVRGTYRMIVAYSNNEQGHSGQVERYAEIAVNGGSPKKVYFRNTFDWSVFRTTVVDVELEAGANTIRFSNSTASAPNIDRISIAAATSAQ